MCLSEYFLDLSTMTSNGKHQKVKSSNILLNLSSADSDSMVEMDQFAHVLSGQQNELIERRSIESSAVMKEFGMSIRE